MALVRVTLSFASRQVINNLFTDMLGVDLPTARSVREIRRRFELAEVRREVDRLQEEVKKVKHQRMLDEQAAVKEGKPLPYVDTDRENFGWEEMLVYEAETGNSARTFTVDDGYLKFLQDLVSKKQWNKFNVVNQQTGELKEITVGLSPGNIEAIADLADALHAAQPVKSEE